MSEANAETVDASGLVAAALQRHQSGDVASALPIYREALRLDKGNPQLTFLAAVAEHDLGRFIEAEEMFRRAVSLDPGVARFHIGLGRNYRAQGKMTDALACYGRARELEPDSMEALIGLGVTLRHAGHVDESIEALEKALRFRPDSFEILTNLGTTLFQAGRHIEAIKRYTKAAGLRPAAAEIHNNLGRSLTILGRHNEARAALQRAIDLRPGYPEALCNLGDLMALEGDRDEAVGFYGRAIKVAPESVTAYVSVVRLLYDAGKLDDALQVLEELEKHRADDVTVLLWRGLVYREQGKLDMAQSYIDAALARTPDNPDALLARASIYWMMGDVTRTIHAVSRVLEFRPGDPAALSARGNAEVLAGRIHEALDWYDKGTSGASAFSDLWHNKLLVGNYIDFNTATDILSIHCAWGLKSQSEIAAPAAPAKKRRQAGPLRVGFVSPDFKGHSVAYFIEPLLARLDRERVEIYCYHCERRVDHVTVRLSQLGVQWRTMAGLPVARAAAMVREDDIDVLIDLAGHTSGNRLDVFAYGAAPVQATYLGYPTTTGLPAISYRITDGVVDPEGEMPAGTETSMRLPASYFCYRAPENTPQVGKLPALSSDVLTFGCFNNLAKISDATVSLWATALRACPQGVMFLKNKVSGEPEVQHAMLERFAAHGIAPQRVRFASWQTEIASHLALYQEIDIALDTIPYNGATTTCEALWMGVPVVTLAGSTHAGRMGASLLRAAGLGEFVARDQQDFVTLCRRLSADIGSLEKLRAGLRDALRTSALMDETGFAKNFEGLLEAMVKSSGRIAG